MASITRFTRTSGRVLAEVRRPVPSKPAKAMKVERPAPEPEPDPVPVSSPDEPAANDADVTVKPASKKKSDG